MNVFFEQCLSHLKTILSKWLIIRRQVFYYRCLNNKKTRFTDRKCKIAALYLSGQRI